MKFIKALCLVGVLFSCREAETVSRNLSVEADSFNVYRRVVFINGITDNHLLTITGYCSIMSDSGAANLKNTVAVVCKTDNNTFVKHFLGVSDNVTFFAEQLTDVAVSSRQYKVIIRPSTMIPDVRIK
jgi:hypothetical protein